MALLLAALAWLPDADAGGGHAAAFQGIHDQIRALQETCEKDPKAWEPRIRLAELSMQFGLSKLALRRLDEAIALRPDHLPAYELAGKARFQLKEYDAAIELWRKALTLSPHNAKLEAWIGQAAKRREQDAQLAELDARLEKKPADPEARLARARIRSERQEWKKAVADLAAYLETKPEDPKALGMAATASFRLNRLEQAIQLWAKAVEADPTNQEYPLRLKQAQQLKETHDALTRVRQQLAKTPNDGKLRLQAGELWARVGRHDYAALNLEQAVRWLPEDPAAHRLYGLVLLRLGRMDEAVTELETCVKLDPADDESRKLLDSAKRTRRMHNAMKRGEGHGDSVRSRDTLPGTDSEE